MESDHQYALFPNSDETFNICGDYYDNHLAKTWTGWASFYTFFAKYIGFFVIGVNFACRQIFIRLAWSIGYTSETYQTEFIKYGIFIVYFTNMSILYVVAPWDSREVDSPLLNTYFQGVYTDYNMMWFRDIGNTVAQTLFLNMFSPVIETFAFTFMRFGFRCLD